MEVTSLNTQIYLLQDTNHKVQNSSILKHRDLDSPVMGPQNKGAFTHPVYACGYRTALHFFITYLGLLISMDKKVITTKTQRNAENACGNRMWQLGFNKHMEK